MSYGCLHAGRAAHMTTCKVKANEPSLLALKLKFFVAHLKDVQGSSWMNAVVSLNVSFAIIAQYFRVFFYFRKDGLDFGTV